MPSREILGNIEYGSAFSFIICEDELVGGNQLLSGHSDFTVARAAVHRSALAWLKWYLGVLTTLGANCGEHLARSVTAAGPVALGFPRLTARQTPLGLISVALGLEELLLLGCEGK